MLSYLLYFNYFCVYSGVAVLQKAVESACPSDVPSSWTPHSDYRDWKYYRVCQGLTSIPADIPAEAREVRIYGNTIHTLRANDFSQLSQCTVLYLDYNDIQEIQVGAFTGLTALEFLDLDYNKISRIEPGAFSGLTALRELHLDNNVISEIQAGLFTGLTALDRLHLHLNDIRHIEPGAFSGLTTLTYLRLHHNALTTLPWTIFSSVGNSGNIHHPSLELALSGNPLHCDTSLCWIKQGEQYGWITWWWGSIYDPECSNYADTNWPDVTLNCTNQGKSI